MATNSVRPRAVDVLFGDATPPSAPASTPAFVVEPAQPVAPTPTPVAPPPPQFVSPPPPATSPRPAPTRAPAVSPQYMPPPPPPIYAPPPRRTTPAPLDSLFGVTDTAPAPAPRMVPASAAAFSKDQSQYGAYLSDMIRDLYEQVSIQLADSPVVSEFCMGVLLKAREAYQSGNFPLAEFYAESVDAKLKRSARSIHASTGIGIWLLWLWLFAMLGFGGFFIGITYLTNLTLFGVIVMPEFLIGMRVIGWGVVGGVISAMYNMPRFVQFREYDPAYAMNYFARPLQGLLAGALIFLISQTFLAATPRPNPGEVPQGNLFVYIVAAFVGFGQQYVWEFFDSILRAIFRNPQASGLTPPRPPS